MARGILIFGPSGSGKTTLGKMVAHQLAFSFIDIDDYIWRKDTLIPFSVMYSRTEKVSRLMQAISKTDFFVMSGSMDSFHAYFDPFFDLAVYLTAPAEVRVARVHQREYNLFGNRICRGGDMYEAHQRFLDDVAAYDFGGGSTSAMLHTKWAESLQCKVLRLDGSRDLSMNVKSIVEEFLNIKHGYLLRQAVEVSSAY